MDRPTTKDQTLLFALAAAVIVFAILIHWL
jgi:hypothetical protein